MSLTKNKFEFGNYLGHDDNDDLKVFVMKAGLVPNLQNKSIDWGGSLNSKQANDLKANSEEAETPGKIGYSLDKGENASSDKYNKFDKEIAVATHLLNREIKAGTLSVGEGYSKGKNATKLDVNLVKALAYKESRLGQGQSVATKASDIFSMFHPGDYGDKSKMGMTLADVKNGAGSLKSTYWGVRWLHFKSYMSEDGKTKDFQGWNYGVNKYGPGQKDPRYLETVLKIYKSIE